MTSPVNYREILTGSWKLLQRSINPSNDLLNGMIRVGFSIKLVEAIRTQATDWDKVGRLLQELNSCSDVDITDVLSRFANVLREVGQEHVANVFGDSGLVHPGQASPMSLDHYELLNSKIADLCKFIDTEGGLTERLEQARVLLLADVQAIRAERTLNRKALELIHIMQRKADHCFECFLSALKETGQSHVVHVLTGEGDRPLMDEWYKVLSAKQAFLVDFMVPTISGLLDQLISREVFSQDEKDRIKNGDSADDLTSPQERMLALLVRKSQPAFDNFIKALIASNQAHIAIEIVGLEVEGKLIGSYMAETDELEKTAVENLLKIKFKEIASGIDNLQNELAQALEAVGTRVTYVGDGCIALRFKCRNAKSLNEFRALYESRLLNAILTRIFCDEFYKRGLVSLVLNIPDEEFARCESTFADEAPMPVEERKALMTAVEMLHSGLVTVRDLMELLSLNDREKFVVEALGSECQQQRSVLMSIVSRKPHKIYRRLISSMTGAGVLSTTKKRRPLVIQNKLNSLDMRRNRNSRKGQNSQARYRQQAPIIYISH